MSLIPRGPTDSYYSPELLETLTDTFQAVWVTLYASVPSESTDAKELKVTLSRTIVALAANGISDPVMLRRRALERMALRT